MGVVADHMNEMQRLCETYWPLIHNLSNDPKLFEVIGMIAKLSQNGYHDLIGSGWCSSPDHRPEIPW